jgi:uncharacterized protein
MLLRPYHKFQNGGITCVLNIEKMNAFRIDEATGSFLESISSDPELPVAPEMEEELKRLELVLRDRKITRRKPASMPEPISIRNISLFVTQDCNFRCTYCYGDRGKYGSGSHMDRETALGAVNWLIDQSGKIKDLNISFLGGEPFLNFLLIKEVVEYAKERGKKLGGCPRMAIFPNLCVRLKL